MTVGEGLAAAGGVRSGHAGAAAAIGGRAAGLANDSAERQELAGGRAPCWIGHAELAAAVGVGAAGLTGRTTTGPGRGTGAGHAGAVATVAVRRAAAAGGRAGRLAADAVHAPERAAVAWARAGLLVGRAADGVETDEIAAARRIDPAEKRATVGVEATGGAVAVAEGERRTGPGGAEARTAVGGGATGASVGEAGGGGTRPRRRQLDVTPAAEGRAHGNPGEQRSGQRSDPGPLRRRQGCAPLPASRRAVATRRPLGNLSR
jgi:hypothetical protein